jgi:hypothetical protein
MLASCARTVVLSCCIPPLGVRGRCFEHGGLAIDIYTIPVVWRCQCPQCRYGNVIHTYTSPVYVDVTLSVHAPFTPAMTLSRGANPPMMPTGHHTCCSWSPLTTLWLPISRLCNDLLQLGLRQFGERPHRHSNASQTSPFRHAVAAIAALPHVGMWTQMPRPLPASTQRRRAGLNVHRWTARFLQASSLMQHV